LRIPVFPIARIAALAVMVLLAACGRSGGPSTSQQALVYPSGGPCLSALQNRQIDYNALGAVNGPGACRIDTPISLNAGTTALNRPVKVNCSIALAMSEFERRVLQPAAQATFNQHIRRVHHMGGYTCRTIAGSRRISQHALGNAIDIAAFELADGSMISVQHDWSGARERSAFLREVARGACETFNVVLSPATDAAHHDHFHFDLGPWRHCSI
jgi:hypothetical protein